MTEPPLSKQQEHEQYLDEILGELQTHTDEIREINRNLRQLLKIKKDAEQRRKAPSA